MPGIDPPATALGTGGAIATGHRLASSAGWHVLAEGGNAVDAALTAAAVMGVVQPMMSGLGADTFLLHRDGASGAVTAINGSGPAPAALTPERVHALGHAQLPDRGMLAPTVPGAVDVLTTALARFGSGRFDLAAILAPAIRYAEEGYPLYPAVARSFARHAELLRRWPSTARTFLDDAGNPPRYGALVRNRDYARALRLVAEGGSEAFYRGPIAAEIVRYSERHGGLFTLEDFAAYRCEVAAPLAIDYRGHRVFSNPPPSQGVVLLEELALAAQYDLAALGRGSAELVHTLVEIKQLAFADRVAAFGDPADHTNPVERVLSAEYAAERVRAIDPQRTRATVAPGDLYAPSAHTTYLCAVDRDGGAVSLITSISNEFGCGEAIEGLGLLLNNRGGRGFRNERGHPNAYGPGRRAMHTLHPYLIVGPDGTTIVGGTPGGDGQPQWNLQTIVDLIDFELPPQAAIDAPRWESFPGTDPAFLGRPFELRMEVAAFDPACVAGLRARGHRVVDAGDERVGVEQIIVRRPDGMLSAGSERNADGVALAL